MNNIINSFWRCPARTGILYNFFIFSPLPVIRHPCYLSYILSLIPSNIKLKSSSCYVKVVKQRINNKVLLNWIKLFSKKIFYTSSKFNYISLSFFSSLFPVKSIFISFSLFVLLYNLYFSFGNTFFMNKVNVCVTGGTIAGLVAQFVMSATVLTR